MMSYMRRLSTPAHSQSESNSLGLENQNWEKDEPYPFRWSCSPNSRYSLASFHIFGETCSTTSRDSFPSLNTGQLTTPRPLLLCFLCRELMFHRCPGSPSLGGSRQGESPDSLQSKSSPQTWEADIPLGLFGCAQWTRSWKRDWRLGSCAQTRSGGSSGTSIFSWRSQKWSSERRAGRRGSPAQMIGWKFENSFSRKELSRKNSKKPKNLLNYKPFCRKRARSQTPNQKKPKEPLLGLQAWKNLEVPRFGQNDPKTGNKGN